MLFLLVSVFFARSLGIKAHNSAKKWDLSYTWYDGGVYHTTPGDNTIMGSEYISPGVVYTPGL